MTDSKSKRIRNKRPKAGEIKLFWGKLPRENPDIIVSNGEGIPKCDAHYVMSTFCSRNPDPHAKPIFSKMFDSFVDEMEKRGYDVTSINFSIRKKEHKVLRDD